MVAEKSTKNLEIEILRATAILFVLYAHVGNIIFLNDNAYLLTRLFVQPGSGVDLFFCISGYVIARSLITAGWLELGWDMFYEVTIPFWIKRFWRLAPSAWLWALVPLFLSITFNASGRFGVPANVTTDAMSVFFQVANLHFYECVNKINAAVCGGSSVYWSLSLEEQFYLVLPFIFFVIPRRFLLYFLAVVVLSQLFIPRHFASILWLTRTDAIALGVIIALLQSHRSYSLTMPRFLTGPVSKWVWLFFWLAMLASVDSPANHFIQATAGLITIISGILVWTGSFCAGLIPSQGVLKRVLIYLGSRSYALYLIHIPAAWFMAELLFRLLGPDPSHVKSLLMLITYPLMFGLAELNYRYLENPLRLYGKQIAEGFPKQVSPG